MKRYVITSTSPVRAASYASTLCVARVKAFWIRLITFGLKDVTIRESGAICAACNNALPVSRTVKDPMTGAMLCEDCAGDDQ